MVNFAFTPGDSVELPAAASGEASVTVESAEDRISFMSSVTITRDAAGLALAEQMASILTGAIGIMQDDKTAGKLPDALALIKPTIRANPLV